MKKSKVLAIMLSVFGAAAVAPLCVACNDGETKYVELDSTVLSMDRYERTTLTAETNDGTIVWTSSDPDVATVDENGVVTSLEGGTAIITAETDNSKAECTVTVESTNQTPVIAQSWQTKEIYVGEEFTIEYSLSYKTVNVTANAEFSTVVEKPAVLKAEANGRFTALAVGTTKVTVTAAYCGWSGWVLYEVTVLEPLEPFATPEISISGSTVSWTAVENAENYTLKIGQTEFKTVTGTSVDLTDPAYVSAVQKGINEISLKANATEDYGDSAYSNQVTYTHTEAFVAPVLTLNGSTLSWAAIEDAEGYTVKINDDETTVVTGTHIDLEEYTSKLNQGNNTISVKVNANEAKHYTTSEYSAAATYFHKTPLETPVLSLNGSVLSWTRSDNAETYTLSINGETFGDITELSVNLLETPYFNKITPGEDNTITVTADATEEFLASAASEAVTYDPLPEGTIMPTADRADANLTYLPSYEGMHHVFHATIGPNREVMVLSDIAEKYADKEYVYFDIWMPESFGTLVGIAYCTGNSGAHSEACSQQNYRHTSEAAEGKAYIQYSTIDISAMTNGNTVVAGWNTIRFNLADQTRVGVGKHSIVSEVYIANIRFTEAPNGVVAPKSANGSLFRLDEYEGKTDVYRGKINNTSGSGEITILDNIAENYANEEFVYFDLWIPTDIKDLVGVAYCHGNSANHEHTTTRHTSQCSLNGSFNETYSTICLYVTTNNKQLVSGWNTIAFKLSEMSEVRIATYGSEKEVFIANIRFEP